MKPFLTTANGFSIHLLEPKRPKNIKAWKKTSRILGSSPEGSTNRRLWALHFLFLQANISKPLHALVLSFLNVDCHGADSFALVAEGSFPVQGERTLWLNPVVDTTITMIYTLHGGSWRFLWLFTSLRPWISLGESKIPPCVTTSSVP